MFLNDLFFSSLRLFGLLSSSSLLYSHSFDRCHSAFFTSLSGKNDQASSQKFRQITIYSFTTVYVCMYVCMLLYLCFSLFLSLSLSLSLYHPIGTLVDCLPMVHKVWVQTMVYSYRRLKKWYLIPPCLTLGIIRYGSRVVEQSRERSSALLYTSAL